VVKETDVGDAPDAVPGAAAGSWDCILIFGYGKSGTKRLLGTLDLSPETHCRNEPYNHSGSPWQRLRTLPRGYIVRPADDALLRAEWDPAVEWCHLLRSARARRLAGWVLPELRRAEWRLPAWAGDRAMLEKSLLVLKINQSPGFACWVLRNRPTQKVIHIVRHPAAVLHSWSTRFLRNQDCERVRRDNINRLKLIANADPSWSERFGDVEGMTVEEAEMWFWLYVTQVTHDAGKGRAQYHLVLDENVIQRPVDVAQTLYRECGLPWAGSVEDALLDKAAEWRFFASPWRDLLEPQQGGMIERILDSSPLREFWNEDQLVSRAEYS
jgi:hypothetical protein